MAQQYYVLMPDSSTQLFTIDLDDKSSADEKLYQTLESEGVRALRIKHRKPEMNYQNAKAIWAQSAIHQPANIATSATPPPTPTPQPQPGSYTPAQPQQSPFVVPSIMDQQQPEYTPAPANMQLPPTAQPARPNFASIIQSMPQPQPMPAQSTYAKPQPTEKDMDRHEAKLAAEQFGAEYDEYVAKFNAAYEADRKAREVRIETEYQQSQAERKNKPIGIGVVQRSDIERKYQDRLSSGQKKMSKDEFARVSSGFANNNQQKLWNPGQEELSEMSNWQKIGQTLDEFGDAVTAPIAPLTEDENTKNRRGVQIQNAFALKKQLEEYKKLAEAGNATDEQMAFIAENDKPWYREFAEGVASVPGFLHDVITDPTAMKDFLNEMRRLAPGSMIGGSALAGIGRAAFTAGKTAQQATRAARLAHAQNLKWKDTFANIKTIDELKSAIVKSNVYRQLAAEFGAEVVSEGIMEALIMSGRGEDFDINAIMRGIGEEFAFGAAPGIARAGIHVGAKKIDNANRVTQEEYNTAVGSGVLADKSDATAGLEGNLVMDHGAAGGNPFITQGLQELSNRPDRADIIREAAAQRNADLTADHRMRVTDRDIMVDVSEEAASHSGGATAGVQSVPGYHADGISHIGKAGNTGTMRHESQHDIEDRIFGENATPEMKAIADDIADWAAKAKIWAYENDVNMPSERELAAEVLTYRLGYHEPQQAAVENIPVPRELLEKIADAARVPREQVIWENKNEFREFTEADNAEVAELASRYKGQFAQRPQSKAESMEDVPFSLAKIDTNNKEFTENANWVISANPIAQITGTEFQKSDINLVTQVSDYFNSIGGKVNRNGLGEIELTRRGVKSSVGHGIGKEKAAAFKAVPDVIKSGRIIDHQKNWKGRGYDTYIIAAPIKIGESDYIMEVVVEQNKVNNRNKYYLHEVEIKSKALDAFKTTTERSAPRASTDNLQNSPDSQPTTASPISFSLASAAGIPEARKNDPKVKDKAAQMWREKGTDSPFFKRWFGDSKVVDDQGKPLVVYHFSRNKGFTIFDKDKLGNETVGGDIAIEANSKLGFWFNDNLLKKENDFIREENLDLKSVYLDIKNPYRIKSLRTLIDELNRYTETQESFIDDDGDLYMPDDYQTADDLAKKFHDIVLDGYDGIIVENDTEFGGTSYVAFSPTQIKSATDNAGTFDGSNPDIRYSLSPSQIATANNAPERNIWQMVRDFFAEQGNFKSIDEALMQYKKAKADNEAKRKAGMPHKEIPGLDKLAERIADKDPALAALIDYENDAQAGENAVEIAAKYDRLSDTEKVEKGQAAQSGYSQPDESPRELMLETRVRNIINTPEIHLDGNAYKEKFTLGKLRSIFDFINSIRLNSKNKNTTFENLDTGDKIIISKESAGKIAQHWKDGDVYQKTIAHIPEIIRRMMLLDEAKDANNSNINYSYFITPTNIDGRSHVILSTVRRAGNDVYYDHNVFNGTVAEVFEMAKLYTDNPKYSRLNEILKDVDREFLQKESDHSLTEVRSPEATAAQAEGNHNPDLVRARSVTEASTNEYTKKSEEAVGKSEKIEGKQQEIFITDQINSLDMESRADIFTRKIQDSMLDLKKLRDQLKNKNADAYKAYDLMHGKQDYAAKQMEEKFVRPIQKIILAHNLDINAVNDYLYALHAPDVNAYVKSQDPKVENGSGHTDQWAKEMLDDFKEMPASKKAAFEAIANLNRNMNKWRIDLLVESGLWSRAKADKLTKLYPNYVPLRGLPAEIERAMGQAGGRGVLKGVAPMADGKRRKGRKSAAQDVMAQNFAITLNAIVNAERNNATQQLWKMAESNPDPKFWELDPHYERKKDATGETEFDYEESRQRNVVPVYRDGEKHYIKFKTEMGKRISDSIKGMTEEQNNAFIRSLGKLNRALGAMITTYSPEFMLTNFTRDYLHAVIQSFGRDGAGTARKVLTNTPQALIALFANEKVPNEWGKWKNKYFEAGGKIGFIQSIEFRDFAQKFSEEIKDLQRSNADPRKMIRKMAGFMEKANELVENSTRISYFRALVENGMAVDKAAQKAKDLTVNFNRKGEWKWLSSVWLFANASIQGIQNVASLFTDKDPAVRKRAYAGAAALLAAGATISLLNHILAGDDDNGRNGYENIPEYVKTNNMIICLGDSKAITIPLPHGWKAIYNAGRLAMDLGMGEHFGALDFSAAMAENIISAFNPFGSDIDPADPAGSIVGLAMPAALKPISDIDRNKDFAGRKIVPESSYSTKPDSQRYFAGVNPIIRTITTKANEWTGGSESIAGAIDVSPETIEHVFNGYTGGMGRIAQQITGMIVTIADGKLPEARQVPFYRRYKFQNHEAADRGTMSEIRKQTQQTYNEYKRLVHKDKGEAQKYLEEHRGEIEFNYMANRIQTALNTINSHAGRLDKAGNTEKAKRMKEAQKEAANKIASAEVKLWDKLQGADGAKDTDAAKTEFNATLKATMDNFRKTME